MVLMGFIGFSELLLIFIVAFIVLGPEKMPEAARNLGRFVREIKKGMSSVDSSLKSEVDEVKKSVGLDDIDDIYKDISRVKQTSKKTMQDLSADIFFDTDHKYQEASNDNSQGRGTHE